MKPASVIRQEGKTHMTKADLARRQMAEDSLLTGKPIQETEDIAADPIAHAAFERVTWIMDSIGKNDELFGAGARRYCQTTSELSQMRTVIKELKEDADTATDPKDRERLNSLRFRYERFRMKLEDELTRFENANCMTVTSAMRMIPEPVKEDHLNPFKELMNL